MTRRATIGGCAVLALLTGTRPMTAAPFELRPKDELAAAADGTWPMAGGCPARTRATRTRLLTGPTETAWSWGGVLEQEPCVWHDRVVVASVGERGAQLDILRLSDGKPVVPRKVFEGRRHLEPVLWNDYVIVRKDLSTFEVLRPVPELSMWAVVTTLQSSQPPLVVDGDLILSDGYTVDRRRLGAERPVWSVRIPDAPEGPLSARGDKLYYVTSRAQEGYVGREVLLGWHHLPSGTQGGSRSLGWYRGRSGQGPAWVAIGADELFVMHPDGVQLKGGTVATASRCAGDGTSPVPFRLTCPPTFWEDRAFLGSVGDEGPVFVASGASMVPDDKGSWRWLQLASATRHREFIPSPHDALVAARGLVRTGVGVFDAASQRIVERYARPDASWSPADSATFAIPARETLLVSRRSGFAALRATKPEALGAAGGPRLPTDGPPPARGWAPPSSRPTAGSAPARRRWRGRSPRCTSAARPSRPSGRSASSSAKTARSCTARTPRWSRAGCRAWHGTARARPGRRTRGRPSRRGT